MEKITNRFCPNRIGLIFTKLSHIIVFKQWYLNKYINLYKRLKYNRKLIIHGNYT